MKTSEIIDAIRQGKIFIYPTDTIYGLGCDATNINSVEKIKSIKQRDKDKPFSVIAPSIKWINDNLIVDFDLKKYFPGAYTVILKKKKKDFLNHVSNTDSLGVRIPKNKFTKIIQKSGVPFVTTSVNLQGEKPITKISEIPEKILKQVDEIIDSGELTGNPSTLVIGGKEVKR